MIAKKIVKWQKSRTALFNLAKTQLEKLSAKWKKSLQIFSVKSSWKVYWILKLEKYTVCLGQVMFEGTPIGKKGVKKKISHDIFSPEKRFPWLKFQLHSWREMFQSSKWQFGHLLNQTIRKKKLQIIFIKPRTKVPHYGNS